MATPSRRTNALQFLISPAGMTCFSLILLGLVYLIPSNLYESLVMEKDYLHSTPFMPIFYTFCSLCVLAGTSVRIEYIAGLVRGNKPDRDPGTYNYTFMIVFWAIVLVANLYSVIVLMRNNAVTDSLSSGAGTLLKTTLNTSGAFTFANPILTATCYWGLNRFLNIPKTIELKSTRRILLAELIAGILLTLALATAKIARYEIIPFLICLAIIFGYHQSRRSQVSMLKIAVQFLGFSVLLTATFLLFSFARGGSDPILLAISVMGYGPASFNHLCAVLQGVLVYPFAGGGTYSFLFLTHIPVIQSFVDVGALLHIQDELTVYRSEFVFTRTAGLNPGFNWITAFGYYFIDLGDWVYPYLFGMGLIIGAGWRSFLRRETFGVIMYPYFASTILLSCTYYIFTQTVQNYVVALIIIGFSEVMAGRSNGRPVPAGPALTPADQQTHET